MYFDGGMGEEGGYLLICFFSIIYILGLVYYKHTIHAHLVQVLQLQSIIVLLRGTKKKCKIETQSKTGIAAA